MTEREKEIRTKIIKYRVMYVTRVLEYSKLTEYGLKPASEVEKQKYEDELSYIKFIGDALKSVLQRLN